VVDSPVDFYHDRVPKKERKKNLVDELMADANFQRYNNLCSCYKRIIIHLLVFFLGTTNASMQTSFNLSHSQDSLDRNTREDRRKTNSTNHLFHKLHFVGLLANKNDIKLSSFP